MQVRNVSFDDTETCNCSNQVRIVSIEYIQPCSTNRCDSACDGKIPNYNVNSSSKSPNRDNDGNINSTRDVQNSEIEQLNRQTDNDCTCREEMLSRIFAIFRE